MADSNEAKSDSGSNRMTRLLVVVVAALLLGIVLLLLAILVKRLDATHSADAGAADKAESQRYDGRIEIDPPQQMSDFTLIDQHGDLTSLSSLRGTYVLLTFGFTSCPDVCPMTLNEFRRIRTSLGDLREQVAFVFVSVDGKRDTPRVIQEYFATRQLEGIIGLTGDEAALRAMGIDYGLSFERTAGKSASSYLVNHTAGSFLLDRQGRWIMRYQFAVLPSSIAADLQELLAA